MRLTGMVVGVVEAMVVMVIELGLGLCTWIVHAMVQALTLALAATVSVFAKVCLAVGSFGGSVHNVVVRMRGGMWTIGRTW